MTHVWLLICLLLAISITLRLVRMFGRPGPIILGTELAAAQSAEDRRIARGALPSILPAERYGSDQSLLIDPQEIPLGTELREIASRYAAADTTARGSRRTTPRRLRRSKSGRENQ